MAFVYIRVLLYFRNMHVALSLSLSLSHTHTHKTRIDTYRRESFPCMSTMTQHIHTRNTYTPDCIHDVTFATPIRSNHRRESAEWSNHMFSFVALEVVHLQTRYIPTTTTTTTTTPRPSVAHLPLSRFRVAFPANKPLRASSFSQNPALEFRVRFRKSVNGDGRRA